MDNSPKNLYPRRRTPPVQGFVSLSGAYVLRERESRVTISRSSHSFVVITSVPSLPSLPSLSSLLSSPPSSPAFLSFLTVLKLRHTQSRSPPLLPPWAPDVSLTSSGSEPWAMAACSRRPSGQTLDAPPSTVAARPFYFHPDPDLGPRIPRRRCWRNSRNPRLVPPYSGRPARGRE